ncbi:MAG: S1 RNA-binding domain-containing protein, partial [Brevinema sp.]
TTIDDIVLELQKPARDPREDFPGPIMQKGVKTFEDLHVGMSVTGKIKNVVDFGAFVDLGIKETALLHLSEMSDNYVSHAMDVVKVGDIVTAKIIDMDEKRRRIGLSMKTVPGSKPPRSEGSRDGNRPAPRRDGAPRSGGGNDKPKTSASFGQATSANNPFAALLNKKGK